jgi:hypothetical protein
MRELMEEEDGNDWGCLVYNQTTDYFDRKCFQLVITRLNKKSISFLFYFILFY